MTDSQDAAGRGERHVSKHKRCRVRYGDGGRGCIAGLKSTGAEACGAAAGVDRDQAAIGVDAHQVGQADAARTASDRNGAARRGKILVDGNRTGAAGRKGQCARSVVGNRTVDDDVICRGKRQRISTAIRVASANRDVAGFRSGRPRRLDDDASVSQCAIDSAPG